jgi:hypothetical protein
MSCGLILHREKGYFDFLFQPTSTFTLNRQHHHTLCTPSIHRVDTPGQAATNSPLNRDEPQSSEPASQTPASLASTRTCNQKYPPIRLYLGLRSSARLRPRWEGGGAISAWWKGSDAVAGWRGGRGGLGGPVGVLSFWAVLGHTSLLILGTIVGPQQCHMESLV